MTTRVYVGNLPADVHERELDDLFYKYGRVDRIELKRLQRPPVFAFVTFRNPRDAREAVHHRNGIDFDGRRLRVELSRDTRPPVSSREPQQRVAGRTWKVHLSNLSHRMSWQDIKDFGRRIAPVVHSNVDHTGTGILEYSTAEDAMRAAQELDGTVCKNPFEQCTVRVKLGWEESARHESSESERNKSQNEDREGEVGKEVDEGERHKRGGRSRRSSRSRSHSFSSRSRSRSRSRDHFREEISDCGKSSKSSTSSSTMLTMDDEEKNNKKIESTEQDLEEVPQENQNNEEQQRVALNKFSYADLRKICKKKGLKSSGKKVDLIASLLEK